VRVNKSGFMLNALESNANNYLKSLQGAQEPKDQATNSNQPTSIFDS